MTWSGGVILGMSRVPIISTFLKMVQSGQTKWTHIALIYTRAPTLEAGTTDQHHVLDIRWPGGIYTVSMSDYISTYKGVVDVRIPCVSLDKSKQEALRRYVDELLHVHIPYENDIDDFFRGSRWDVDGRQGPHRLYETKSQKIRLLLSQKCSETVALIWQKLGWVDPTLVASTFNPTDFDFIGDKYNTCLKKYNTYF